MTIDEVAIALSQWRTADELRVARAAIRWANSAHDIDGLIAEIAKECIDSGMVDFLTVSSIIRKHFGKE